MALLYRVMKGKTRPVDAVNPELAQLIERLKSPSRELRPTAVEALDRLRHIQRLPIRRMRLVVALAFAVVLIAGCAHTVGSHPGSRKR